jgi:hypothetical protein
MIRFLLSVEDLADTRFAVSPLHETVLSLRVLREPGLLATLLPWRRAVLDKLSTLDAGLLMSLVGPRLTLPDFLTPRPTTFTAAFDEELAVARHPPADLIRRDLAAVYAPQRLPDALRNAVDDDDAQVIRLREDLCTLMQRYWDIAIRPY